MIPDGPPWVILTAAPYGCDKCEAVLRSSDSLRADVRRVALEAGELAATAYVEYRLARDHERHTTFVTEEEMQRSIEALRRKDRNDGRANEG